MAGAFAMMAHLLFYCRTASLYIIDLIHVKNYVKNGNNFIICLNFLKK